MKLTKVEQTIKESIKLLEDKGFKVYSDGKPEDEVDSSLWGWTLDRSERRNELKKYKGVIYRVWKGDYFYGVYKDRELIRFAKGEADNKAKKIAKEIDKHKNRARTKHLIVNERFDDIPLNGPTYREDSWNWG